MTQVRPNEIDALLALSASLGSNPLLVQASSGNTSAKLNGVLWIKASGKWLAQAAKEDTFLPVSLDGVIASIRRNEEVRATGASIETAMHAVLPHKVVVHVHSVNTIAWAVRRDGPERVAERLEGLHWRWIPYAASGLPLAQAIRAETADSPATDVLVLANHGLVVCGDSCSAAADLLGTVEERLAVPPRPADPDNDSISARILRQGILVPCQAMFLGFEPLILNDLVAGGLTSCQSAVLTGLLQVVRRLDESAQIRYLSRSEVEGLLISNVYGRLQEAILQNS